MLTVKYKRNKNKTINEDDADEPYDPGEESPMETELPNITQLLAKISNSSNPGEATADVLHSKLKYSFKLIN